jgi:hypothetical protein
MGLLKASGVAVDEVEDGGDAGVEGRHFDGAHSEVSGVLESVFGRSSFKTF